MNQKNVDVFIGIEIGGTKLQLVTSDGAGTINERLRYFIKAADGAEGIKRQIEEGIQKLLSIDTIRSIGVGFGGPVDWKTGEIQLSHQIEGWGNFNMKSWLEKLSALPVSIDNDANTAALAEATKGCGRGFDNVFYMTIGSGIGGGLVVNQQIYHGRIPGEVEIGHLRLDKSGVTLENKCSGWAVNNKVRSHIQKNPNSRLSLLSKDKAVPEAFLLTPALNENDPDALAIIDDVADDIAFALSHVVHLFNPAIIVIGGGLSLLKDHLIKPVSEKLPQYLLKALLPAPAIVTAFLGEDVVPIGAIELARYALKNYSPTKTNTF